MATNSVGDTKRDLRELLLVNLDLIQQQHELMTEKDVTIQSLRQENETLKCRLERIERRMSLQQQKKAPVQFPADTAQHKVAQCTTDTHLLASTPSQSKPSRPSKRKIAMTGVEHSDAGSQSDAMSMSSHSMAASSLHQPHSTKRRFLARGKAQTAVGSTDQGGTGLDSVGPCGVFGDRVAGRRTLDVSGRSRGDSDILTTDASYYSLATAQSTFSDDTLDEERITCTDNVPVPSWRINVVHGLYVIEGTENLNDSMFVKRHQKSETEEKRRKRWDMQRMRDLLLLQKNGNNATRNNVQATDLQQQAATEPFSFVPELDRVLYIDVSQSIPVSAFGSALPRVAAIEFSLPWASSKDVRTATTKTVKSRIR